MKSAELGLTDVDGGGGGGGGGRDDAGDVYSQFLIVLWSSGSGIWVWVGSSDLTTIKK